MSQEGMRIDEATKKPGLSLAERLGLVGYRNQSRSE